MGLLDLHGDWRKDRKNLSVAEFLRSLFQKNERDNRRELGSDTTFNPIGLAQLASGSVLIRLIRVTQPPGLMADESSIASFTIPTFLRVKERRLDFCAS